MFQLRLLRVEFEGEGPGVKQNVSLHLLHCLCDLRQSISGLCASVFLTVKWGRSLRCS